MIQHLPILQVVIPLLAAPLCLLIRNRVATRLLATGVCWYSFANALLLLRTVQADGPWSYVLGGWEAPLGVEIRIYLTNAFVLVVVTAIAGTVLLFADSGNDSRLAIERRYLFNAAYLLCLAGLSGMAVTADTFNTFVFLEITSLSSYSLIAMGHHRRALMAAFSYLIIGTIGGTFILLGVGGLYQMTGTLNIQDLAERLPAAIHTRTISVSFAFLVVGISIKLAVFPLHQWLPNAYTYAPSKVSAFLSGTATKVSYYLLLRVVFTIFGAAYVFDVLHFHLLLLPLSLLAMFAGSVAAIYQDNLKRMLAYSSIAQVGYMTLGLSFNNLDGLTGGLVHLFNHGLMKSGLFLVMACVFAKIGSVQIADFAGLGRKMPITMCAFVIGGLSLIGVPGTVGFVSKWYLVLGAIERGWSWVAGMILLSSLLAVVYIWRVVEVAYFGQAMDGDVPAPEGSSIVSEASPGQLVPTLALISATVVFGLWATFTSGTARQAAEQLMGILP